ncbi:hypothetical protein VTK73DRAFT_7586 [Phialemonium thermophilum]|uniref:Uncharacterized protein n=1 Tax=Phialemonium thermophilum TaxID=223376 RepID=A0ABR3WDP9_9PEZI
MKRVARSLPACCTVGPGKIRYLRSCRIDYDRCRILARLQDMDAHNNNKQSRPQVSWVKSSEVVNMKGTRVPRRKQLGTAGKPKKSGKALLSFPFLKLRSLSDRSGTLPLAPGIQLAHWTLPAANWYVPQPTGRVEVRFHATVLAPCSSGAPCTR